MSMHGDGGFLVCELFPGLADYLKECSIAIPTLELEMHNYTLLPFREADHDVMELGHVLEFNARDLAVVARLESV